MGFKHNNEAQLTVKIKDYKRYMMINYVVFSVAIICYILAGVLFTQQFFQRSNHRATLSQVALMVALTGHLALLILSLDTGSSEQLSLAFVATMLAWLVTLTMFFTNKFIKNLLFLPVVCFVSAFIISLDMFFPSTTGISITMSLGMIFHILLSLIAFGLLSISMLYACQLAYINYQLKQKSKIMLTGQLPPLMSVEGILYKLMSAGTGFLLIALLSGFIFVPNMFADGYAHKTLLSSIALICYLACIVLHKTVGLSVRITVIFNLFGLTLLTLGYFGSRLVKAYLLT